MGVVLESAILRDPPKAPIRFQDDPTVLFEVAIQEKAAGAETVSPFLRLVGAQRDAEQE